jgi:hypothetical protein
MHNLFKDSPTILFFMLFTCYVTCLFAPINLLESALEISLFAFLSLRALARL